MTTIREQVENKIVVEPTGGQVFDDDEARKKHTEFIDRLGWEPEYDANNPLYPWKHNGEIWLTNLLFRNGDVSRKTTDEFLGAFVNKRITMLDGPIQFKNSREMIKVLDIAARKGAVSYKNACLCTV